MIRYQDIYKLIKDFGQEWTLSNKTYSAYNPSTGSSTKSTSNSYTVKAYFFNSDEADKDNSNIVVKVQKVAIPAIDTSGSALSDVSPGDQLTKGSEIKSITRVVKIYNKDTVVCYICSLRD